jgi:HlyD family secretion protein
VKKLWLLVIPVAVAIAFAALRRAAPPEVPFARVTRETLISTLTTNGKAEPVAFSTIRAETAGTVVAVSVQRGQLVQKGQSLVQLSADRARAELSAAEARIAQSRAEAESLAKGGNAREIAAVESGLATARAQLANSQRDYEALQRLQQRKAATQSEVDAARQTVERAELEIQSLERRRASLVTGSERAAAQARVREAESGAEAARVVIGSAVIRSPMSGVLYSFNVRPGDYLNPGDLVGQAGVLTQMRVTVYVDEPELGRVQRGMPVTITWDALPGREWKGTVETTPTQIVTLGTRQVGEVVCIVDNPDQSLTPGANVNAEIRTAEVPNALTIPNEAVRRRGNETGVFKLDGDLVRWQPIRTGTGNVTRVQVLSGLREREAVAVAGEIALTDGQTVRPVMR